MQDQSTDGNMTPVSFADPASLRHNLHIPATDGHFKLRKLPKMVWRTPLIIRSTSRHSLNCHASTKSTSTMLTRFSRRLRLQSTVASRALSSAASSSSSLLKVLVIDGYAPEGRADLEAGGASTAGKLYIDLLNKSAPAGVEIASDVVYPADSNFHTPELSKVSCDTEWSSAVERRTDRVII